MTGNGINPAPGRTEERLLHDTQQGDQEALDALLQRHLPSLRVFCRLRINSFLRQRESEMDVVQSVCRELLGHLEGFDYQGDERFRNWLYVAVLNKLREKEKYYRARKRNSARERSLDRESVLANAYDSVFTPSHYAMAHERVQLLEAAFDQLPEHYREVITLAKVARLSQEEMARTMGRSVASARNLLTRALVRLSAILEGMEGEDTARRP